MRIVPAAELSNGRIRLEYYPAPAGKRYSFSIKKEYADEFVKEYNLQNSRLNKMGIALTLLGALGGFRSMGKDIFTKIFNGIPIGAIVGFLTAVAISHNRKDKLMSRYDVESCDEEVRFME